MEDEEGACQALEKVVGGRKANWVGEIYWQCRLSQKWLKKDGKHRRQKKQVSLLRGNIT